MPRPAQAPATPGTAAPGKEGIAAFLDPQEMHKILSDEIDTRRKVFSAIGMKPQ